MSFQLQIDGSENQPAIEERLATWEKENFGARLSRKDPTLWFDEPQPELENRLGWLDLPNRMSEVRPGLSAFGKEVADNGFTHAVVLGMGGSSLAPEVYQAVFGSHPPQPELLVLDSTHPQAIKAVEEQITLTETLFIVSSKSGTTLETLSFFRYFWDQVGSETENPGDHFVAVTDPGSNLEQLAGERGFRRVFKAPPDVGGRYSALTEFGLVPAAAIGVDLEQMQHGALDATNACGPNVAATDNPGLALGAFLGEMAVCGQDKATFLAPPRLRPLVAWIEQLVAESTGKSQNGIVPVGGDDAATRFGDDRAFVAIELADDPVDADLELLRGAGHPVARLRLDNVADLGGAMFILEVAVAASGAVLGIHPFNQPDVQLAKDLARQAMNGKLDTSGIEELDALDPKLADKMADWLEGITPPEYVGIHAYLPPTEATRAAMETARAAIRDEREVAATFDFGPRFLHSTGQLHKGGPPVGRFLQVIDHPKPHLRVPESDFTFDELIGAQSAGDYQALRDRNQRVLLVCLGDSGSDGLEAVMRAVVEAARR